MPPRGQKRSASELEHWEDGGGGGSSSGAAQTATAKAAKTTKPANTETAKTVKTAKEPAKAAKSAKTSATASAGSAAQTSGAAMAAAAAPDTLTRAVRQHLKAAEEEAAAATTSVPPTRKEVLALRKYCHTCVTVRSSDEERSAMRAPLKAAMDEARSALEDILRAKGVTVAVLARADLRRLEAQCVAKGIAAIPPYIRLVRNSKDATITPTRIEDALKGVTDEDIDEAATQYTDTFDILVAAVTEALRREVRSYTEQVRLTDSLERNVRAVDVEEAVSATAELAWRLHACAEEVKRIDALGRTVHTKLNKVMKEAEEDVRAYIERSGFKSCPINVKGVPYNLSEMTTTVGKLRLTLGNTSKWLKESAQESWGMELNGVDALKHALRDASKREDLIRSIVGRLASDTGTVTTKLVLKKITQRKQEDEEEEGDE